MCQCGLQHHAKYYIKDGDFFFKCEGTLFRIHSFFLQRDSSKFRKLLETPACPNKPSCGRSETTAFDVRIATAEEFAKFCWVIYNETYSLYDATSTEWLSILKIACKYNFKEATRCAIRGLLSSEMCSLELIKHFHEYEVPSQHLIPLYAHLCRLENGPEDCDIAAIGGKVSFNIFRTREYLLKNYSESTACPVLKYIDEDLIVDAICQVFGFDKPTCKRGTVGTRRRSHVAGSAISSNREAYVCYDPRGHRKSGLAGSLATLSRLSSFSGTSSWVGQQQQQQRRRRQSQAIGVGDVHVHVQTQVRNGVTMRDIAAAVDGDKDTYGNTAEALSVSQGMAVSVYPGHFEEVWIKEGEGEGLSGVVSRFPCLHIATPPILLLVAPFVRPLFPLLQFLFIFPRPTSARAILVFVALSWTFALYLCKSLIPTTPIYIL